MNILPNRIAQGIIDRERRFLSRAITLTESSLPQHTTAIGEVLRETRKTLLKQQSNNISSSNNHNQNHNHNIGIKPRPRIAITGNPGVGKSSLLEVLGMHLVEDRNMDLGILAVDPSDADRGGSILGDKTRMEKLSLHPKAFVRPSPSRGALGGVTARAWEALEVFEAAGFDMTLVETVGVGQSEIEAKHLTDVFVLLVPPIGGDDLQGVKRGIVQAADLIVVTKADEGTPQQELAEQAAGYYRRASSLLHSTYSSSNQSSPHQLKRNQKQNNPNLCSSTSSSSTEVMCVSAKTGFGIPTLADKIIKIYQEREIAGEVHSIRQEQRLRHFRSYFEQTVINRATQQLKEAGMYESYENQVASHLLTPREAGDVAMKKLGFKF